MDNCICYPSNFVEAPTTIRVTVTNKTPIDIMFWAFGKDSNGQLVSMSNKTIFPKKSGDLKYKAGTKEFYLAFQGHKVSIDPVKRSKYVVEYHKNVGFYLV